MQAQRQQLGGRQSLRCRDVPAALRRSVQRRDCSVRASERFDAQVAVVLGTQWGDEGKGKLVDILAQQYDVVARAQVGWQPRHEGRSRIVTADCSEG